MTTNQRNEGEGNRTADKAYVDATKRFIDEGKVKPAAKEAERSLDSPEAKDLAEAEQKGRDRAHGER